jgi:hypothetical protein
VTKHRRRGHWLSRSSFNINHVVLGRASDFVHVWAVSHPVPRRQRTYCMLRSFRRVPVEGRHNLLYCRFTLQTDSASDLRTPECVFAASIPSKPPPPWWPMGPSSGAGRVVMEGMYMLELTYVNISCHCMQAGAGAAREAQSTGGPRCQGLPAGTRQVCGCSCQFTSYMVHSVSGCNTRVWPLDGRGRVGCLFAITCMHANPSSRVHLPGTFPHT